MTFEIVFNIKITTKALHVIKLSSIIPYLFPLSFLSRRLTVRGAEGILIEGKEISMTSAEDISISSIQVISNKSESLL